MVNAIGICSELDRRRRELGMPLDELSQRAGVSVSTAKRFLAGKIHPRWDSVLRISETLGAPGLDLPRAQAIYKMRQRQAVQKAKLLVGFVQGTMALEAQAVDLATKKSMQREATIQLLAGPRSALWAT